MYGAVPEMMDHKVFRKEKHLKCCERAMKRPDREEEKGRTINN